MSRLTIADPIAYPVTEVLRFIEQDPDSFTEGRRNNDIVNWFVICRIGEQQEGIELRAERFYVDDFEEMMEELSEEQVYELEDWSESYAAKIRTLHKYYGRANITGLRSVWQAQDYETKPDVHEDQTELPV